MHTTSIATRIEELITSQRPDVEVYAVVVIQRGRRVRVLIDHPSGVDHGLCADVTRLLDPLRDEYALEVSSPGVERPLITTRHYTNAVGERVAVRLGELVSGRRSVRGRLIAADDGAITLRLDDGGAVELPRRAVAKTTVVWEG
jgi:ribosome maturation factor RimP